MDGRPAAPAGEPRHAVQQLKTKAWRRASFAVLDEGEVMSRAQKRLHLQPTPSDVVVSSLRNILFETGRTNRASDERAARLIGPHMAIQGAPAL